MFHSNLKNLRKTKGLSQEELAIRLNVVRQTVSKWEKALSVPDADLLIRIAENFEVSVSELLGENLDFGESMDAPKEINIIAEQLSRMNEQLAITNRRSRLIWKIVGVIVAAIILINIAMWLLAAFGVTAYDNTETVTTITVNEDSLDS